MKKLDVAKAEIPGTSHEPLRKHLRQLEDALRATSALSPQKLGVQLAGLRGHLIEHFSLEEQNGWKDAVLTQDPRLEHAVGALIDEHKRLLQALNTLIDKSEIISAVDATICEKVLRWIHRVRDHEAREDDLLDSAFVEDLGAGD